MAGYWLPERCEMEVFRADDERCAGREVSDEVCTGLNCVALVIIELRPNAFVFKP